MFPNFLRRYRRRREDETIRDNIQGSNDIESQPLEVSDQGDDARQRSVVVTERALLVMAQNHMVAFVLILYAIYLFCRLLGWKPGSKTTTCTLNFGKDREIV